MGFDKGDVIRRHDAMGRRVVAAVGFRIETITNEDALDGASAEFRIVSINM